jgi:VWFA-related protein
MRRANARLMPGRALSVAVAAGAAALFASTPASHPWSTPVLAGESGQGSLAPTEQRPVFRGGTVLVAVDVYPRRNGSLVEGLGPADFEVTEDGKPQTVESFQFIRHERSPIDAERRDPTSIADSERQAADPANRLFVVYLNPLGLSLLGAENVQSSVMRLLAGAIDPRDLFGLMTLDTPPSQLTFGRRLEVLESNLAATWHEALQDERLGYRYRNDLEWQLDNCAPSLLADYHADRLYTSLEGLIHRLRDIREGRKHLLLISGPFRSSNVQRRALNEPRRRGGNVPQIGVSPLGRLGTGNEHTPVGRDDHWCDLQEARLTRDYADRYQRLLELARQANVSIHPLDLESLKSGARQQTPFSTLADNTDGVVLTGLVDVRVAIEQIRTNLAGYYLLGYYSTNPATDGRFRAIRVRVRRRGVDVSARAGYFAPTAAMLAASIAPPAPPPTAVDAELGRLARSRPDVDLHGYAAFAGSRLTVVIELPSRLVQSGEWNAGAVVRATLRGSTGAVDVQGRIEPGARSAALPVSVAADDRGPWKIEVRATGDRGQLETETTAATPAGPILGDPLLFRAAPSARSVLRAVADLQYRRTERIHVEWPVLNGLTERTATLLDRQGRPLPVTPTLSDRDDGQLKVVVLDLILAPLQEGDYVIELTGVTGQETQRALLAFRIIR